jgi:hypothetical protein
MVAQTGTNAGPIHLRNPGFKTTLYQWFGNV